MFKIRDGFKLELQTPETMKLFGSTKKLINKAKMEKNVLGLEIVEVVLVQCNLVDNQYQQLIYLSHLEKKESSIKIIN